MIILWYLGTGQLKPGRDKIGILQKAMADRPGLDHFGPTDQAGDFGSAGFDQRSFPFRSMIRHEDHDGVVGNAEGIELVEDQSRLSSIQSSRPPLQSGHLLDPFPYGFAIDQPKGFQVALSSCSFSIIDLNHSPFGP